MIFWMRSKTYMSKGLIYSAEQLTVENRKSREKNVGKSSCFILDMEKNR